MTVILRMGCVKGVELTHIIQKLDQRMRIEINIQAHGEIMSNMVLASKLIKASFTASVTIMGTGKMVKDMEREL
jgi:hypothetical protein